MKTNLGALKKLASLVSIAGLTLIMAARPAFASTSTQTGPVAAVKTYEIPAGSGLSLLILSSGVNYFAQVTPASGCQASSVDEIKTYTSLAQSALLAGKTLQISYNLCGGVNYIVGVQLNP